MNAIAFEMPGAGIAPMVDTSTAHLVLIGGDDEVLNHLARFASREESAPRVLKHRYGWLLFLSGDDEEQAEEIKALFEKGASQSLLDAVHYSHKAGAYILNFDQDASEFLPGVAIND